MKYTRLFMAVLCLCLLLCGCSKSEEAPATTQVQTVPTTQPDAPAPKLGLCARNEADDPNYYAALQQVFSQAGFEVVFHDSKNDQAQQDTQIQSLVDLGCSVIVSEPVMVTAQETAITSAKTAGIPLVLINYQPEQAILESYEKLCYIGFDPAEPAIMQASAVEALPDGADLNGDGLISYAVVTGPEDHLDAQLHVSGSDLKAESEKLSVVNTDWTLEGSHAACAELLANYGPDLEVILCGNGAIAQSAIQAVEEGGWRVGQDMYVLALGDDPQALSLVAQGVISSTVIQDEAAAQSLLLQTVKDLLWGEPPAKINLVPHITVTVDNAAEFTE